MPNPMRAAQAAGAGSLPPPRSAAKRRAATGNPAVRKADALGAGRAAVFFVKEEALRGPVGGGAGGVRQAEAAQACELRTDGGVDPRPEARRRLPGDNQFPRRR